MSRIAPTPAPAPRPAPNPAGRAAFGLESDAREYDANGHYIHGPRLVAPPLVRLIAERVLDVEIAAREKAPSAERRKLGREASRATRMRRLLAGQFAPARRKDAA